MNDSQLLSSYQELPPSIAETKAVGWLGGRRPRKLVTSNTVLVFDACRIGVVLRAVLFVQAVVAVAAAFLSASAGDWLSRSALLTAFSLPSVVLWLGVGCALKWPLSRVHLRWQVGVGIGLGALAGVYSFWMAWLVGVGGGGKWLASVAAGALLGGVMVAALVWRSRAQMPAATVARLSELQSRIRPHFLFNTLNSAIALVREDPKRAEAVLEDLSELFHHALAAPAQYVTLADELDLAKRYLAIEHVRFGERMRVEWALDESTHAARVPPMLLQPLVENAVKHGIEQSVESGQIKISTLKRGNSVVVKVTNTVDGLAPVRHGHGIALANVRERLALLHDLNATFQTALKDGVFQARIELPLDAQPAAGKSQ